MMPQAGAGIHLVWRGECGAGTPAREMLESQRAGKSARATLSHFDLLIHQFLVAFIGSHQLE